MTPDRGDTRVALAGDWHGNINWIQRAIPFLRRQGVKTIYHLGDLGYWGPKDPMLDTLEYWLNAADINLFCTPGNHENWTALDQLFAAADGAPAQLTPHSWMMPRGHRWEHGGRSFVSLGGAPSHDRSYRTAGKDWWPTEVITAADVTRTTSEGHAEVMLTHDAPTDGTAAVRAIRAGSTNRSEPVNQDEWDAVNLGVELLDTAVDAVRPTLLAHGHFHVKDEGALADGRRVMSFACEGMAGNLAILDLATLETQWLVVARR